ncbi:hypothetical protein FBEOM_9371 [Fusarium beomiforme]|uniref:Uncharacterized protein n=1 Tax=Fusarium beomiforme TaxID=44412 RepID=A0A9P5ADD5_9HYPO|nr:hypothetical protein FBEOM_9371 [Fusarium beomiforme]
MADQEIAEVLDLISRLTQSEMREAFISAFNKPSPPIKASIIRSTIADPNYPKAKATLQMMYMEKPFVTFDAHVQPLQFQPLYKYPDGTQAGIMIGGPVWKPRLHKSSSGFGAVSLASTGDWARFGKGLGLNVAGGTASWAGACAGAYYGGFLGPIGAIAGGLVGGTGAGWLGRAVASIYVPGLGGRTDYETRTAVEAMMGQLESANLEHDPALTDLEAAELAISQGAGSNGGLPFNV